MLVLGIETATSLISVAVGSEGQIAGEVSLSTRQAHMQRLLPAIDRLLEDTGLMIEEIEALAVSVGPGSFTSLRVGMATAKALAHALGRPLVGVPTLDALAWNFRGCGSLVCPVLTARRDEVYCAFYIDGGAQGMKRLSGYLSLNPRHLARRLAENDCSGVLFAGEGARAYWKIFQENLGERAALAEADRDWPRAATVVVMGCRELARGAAGAPDSVHALYVKQPAIKM